MSGASIRDVKGLVAAGLVEPARADALSAVAKRYAVALTPSVAGLIDPTDPDDPIARQFVPHEDERVTDPLELPDPIGDEPHAAAPGVVHRYPDRALLKLTHACPVYCRFCFRRETVGPGGPQTLSGEAFERALAYLAGRPEIWEVILTGGDPLALSSRRLAEVASRLGAIAHIGVLRIHTRVPMVDPSRITPALVAVLTRARPQVWVAIHANHPREFTPEAKDALARLAEAGVPLVSQTVLLRGVNDDPDVLAALMRRFVENRVKPYYLHHADLAPGTRRFRTSIDEGRALMRALRGRLSGLAQPLYVLDIPGGFGKAPIAPDYARPAEQDRGHQDWRVEDWRGGVHGYSDAVDPKKT